MAQPGGVAIRRPASRSGRERVVAVPSARALALPLTFTLVLIALGFLPSVRQQPILRWSFWGASVALVVWNTVLVAMVRRRGRTLAIEFALRKQHYIQACAHLSILAYWGWYWH